ncbi:MAG: hypothetical protein LQ341_006199 [Variospora aurantia]|nr:MAG: hypothetical protein LQ341_006199 [Variospora aurantia]
MAPRAPEVVIIDDEDVVYETHDKQFESEIMKGLKIAMGCQRMVDKELMDFVNPDFFNARIIKENIQAEFSNPYATTQAARAPARSEQSTTRSGMQPDKPNGNRVLGTGKKNSAASWRAEPW